MKIAVFFPGIGYHCDKPLLYYSRKIVEEAHYDQIITLSYSYDGKNIKGNKEKMKEAFEVLYTQTKESLAKVKFDQYSEVLFVSKSVGTVIASAYAQKIGMNCRQILYTPLEETFMYDHDSENTIAFMGDKDPWSNLATVKQLAGKQDVNLKVYEGVNHSLEMKDVLRNIEILTDVMEETKKFLLV